MIDPADRQTKALPLDEQEPTKRGRGRPSTGKALSNADRQRAYRERQKSQRNANGEDPAELREALERLGERQLELEAKLTEKVKDIALLQKQLDYWIGRADEIAQEAGINPEKRWVIECKRKGRRKWGRTADNRYTLEDAAKNIETMKKHFPEDEYRATEV